MTPNVQGFAPIGFEGTEAWFQRQDTEAQRRIMGPGMLAAYQEGQFEWRDMATIRPNDIWGLSAQSTPLKELVKD